MVGSHQPPLNRVAECCIINAMLAQHIQHISPTGDGGHDVLLLASLTALEQQWVAQESALTGLLQQLQDALRRGQCCCCFVVLLDQRSSCSRGLRPQEW
jgi:hypothetical protein